MAIWQMAHIPGFLTYADESQISQAGGYEVKQYVQQDEEPLFVGEEEERMPEGFHGSDVGGLFHQVAVHDLQVNGVNRAATVVVDYSSLLLLPERTQNVL